MRPTFLFAMLMIALSSSPLLWHKTPAPSMPASIATVPMRVEPATPNAATAKAGVSHAEHKAGIAPSSHADDQKMTAVVYSMPAE